MGTLYLVGTPIGNLEDITLRALRILKQVPLVAAEDTRVTRRLLAHHGIDTQVTSYHEHSQHKLPELLAHLEADDLALVSDAGMPGLSDPGYELVRAAVERELPVVPVPGPSAVITALVASGLPSDSFLYIGFLPRRRAARRQALERVAHQRATVIAFEAPHRLRECLEQIREVLGERPMVVARELTKYHEEYARGSPSELLACLTQTPARGEITLVIGGAPKGDTLAWDDQEIERALARQMAEGSGPAEAAKIVAALSGRPRRDLYRLALKKKERPDDRS